MIKQFNTSNQKAYQRTDTEDRSLPYKNWLRTVETNGFFCDIDLIKFKEVDGVIKPVAITELTRCDSDEIGQPYLDAIFNRVFNRDSQGKIIQKISDLLKIPAYLILFQKEMKWLWVYSFNQRKWKEFTLEGWAKFLSDL